MGFLVRKVLRCLFLFAPALALALRVKPTIDPEGTKTSILMSFCLFSPLPTDSAMHSSVALLLLLLSDQFSAACADHQAVSLFTVVLLSGLKKFPGGTLEMQVNGFGKEGGRGKSALLLRCSVPLLTEAREAAGAVGPLCSNPSHAPH